MERIKDLISIIVPVYNVSKYLEKCLTSLINQKYQQIEIILVNDGSTDNSLEICEKYKSQDSRIILVNQKNKGLSAARNRGLDIAKGQYIGFVDSDDWIEEDMYYELHRMLIKEKCDLVECAVNYANGDQLKIYEKGDNYILSGRDAVRKQLLSDTYEVIPRIAVWSKLFSASFWEKRRFPEGYVHEDYFLTCQALYESERVGVVNIGLYNHLISNLNSITHDRFSRKEFYIEEQFKKRVEYFHDNRDRELEKIAKEKYYLKVFNLYYKCHKNNMDEKEKFRKIILNNIGTIKKLQIESRFKWKMLLLAYCPRIYDFASNEQLKRRALENGK